MRLFEADAHLEYARLELKTGDKGEAGRHFGIASGIVADTGYHRRDGATDENQNRRDNP